MSPKSSKRYKNYYLTRISLNLSIQLVRALIFQNLNYLYS